MASNDFERSEQQVPTGNPLLAVVCIAVYYGRLQVKTSTTVLSLHQVTAVVNTSALRIQVVSDPPTYTAPSVRVAKPMNSTSKPQFTKPCRNGPSCRFLAAGTCTFRHDADIFPVEPAAEEEEEEEENTPPRPVMPSSLSRLNVAAVLTFFAGDATLCAAIEAFAPVFAVFDVPADDIATPMVLFFFTFRILIFRDTGVGLH